MRARTAIGKFAVSGAALVLGGVLLGCAGAGNPASGNPTSAGPGEKTASSRQALATTNGLFQNGLFQNGLTSNGLFQNGLFQNGLFQNGLFQNGLFQNGLFQNGLYQNGLFQNGLFQNGLFQNGLFQNGLFQNGLFQNGLFQNGLFQNGLFQNGLFQNGLFQNGLYQNGLFQNGLFQNGLYATTLRESAYAREVLQYIYACAMPGSLDPIANAAIDPTTYNATLDPNALPCSPDGGSPAGGGNGDDSGSSACPQGFVCSSQGTCAIPCTPPTGAGAANLCAGGDPGDAGSSSGDAGGGCADGYTCSTEGTCVVPLCGSVGLGINSDGTGWWGELASGGFPSADTAQADAGSGDGAAADAGFAGGAFGLAGLCDETCQRWVSACVLARTNAYGVHVTISMRVPASAPQAIQNALATSPGIDGGPSETQQFSLREGAYYGNLFAQTPVSAPPPAADGGAYTGPNTYPVTGTPSFNACAGPESNVPELTKRFCSSQGDQVVINVSGVCKDTASETGACDGIDGTNSVYSCYTSPAARTQAEGDAGIASPTPDSQTHYNEVITVYLQEPVAVCGNGVCEPPTETPLCCPSDCHPATWAKDLPPALDTGAVYPGAGAPIEFSPNASSALAVAPPNTPPAIAAVDGTVAVAGNASVDICPECTLSLGGNTTLGSSLGNGVLTKYKADGTFAWPDSNAAVRFGSASPLSSVNPLQTVAGTVVGSNPNLSSASPGYLGNITVAGVTTQIGSPNQQLWISSFGPDGTPLGTWIPNLVGGPTLSPYGGTLAFDSQGNLVLGVSAAAPTSSLLSNVVSVSVGLQGSACALLSDGTVECWGEGAGPVFNGITTNSSTPVPVIGLSGATAVSVGNDFACAVLLRGSVECWGDNSFGQLGNGTSSPASMPLPVVGIASAIAVSAGGTSACALLSGGTVECWGDNSSGKLGNGTTQSSLTPVAVQELFGATALSVGSNFACARMSGGPSVECWGDNSSGELGNATTQSSSVPVIVHGLSGVRAVSVGGGGGAGGSSACALLSGGTIACWGDNSFGQLGNGTNQSSSVPVGVVGLSAATAISTGVASSCALLSTGTVECWGDNDGGELGNGTTLSSPIPVGVTGLSGATAVSAGLGSSCAALAGGTVECWGDNGGGNLGNGTITNSETPVPVLAPPGAPPSVQKSVDVSDGAEFACELLSNGTAACWGNNSFGQLGNGTMNPSSTPIVVPGLTGAAAIASGNNVACALLSGGAVKCWGSNGFGQLGDGSTADSSTPVAVVGLTDATAISVGSISACALLSDGTAQCWGDNSDGELGNGTTTGPVNCPVFGPCWTTPVSVSGLAGAVAISVGGGSACALLAGGTVECWGLNSDGRLGNGTTTNSSVPVPVSNLTGAKAISAEGACAILSSGTIECWGDNVSGGLGNGSTTGPQSCAGTPCSTTPVVVSGIGGATAISNGNGTTCALLSTGAIECWGQNSFGELGIGTTTGPQTCQIGPCSATPIPVSGISDGSAISVGNGETVCAGLSGGTVECWGNTSSIPVAVVQPSFNQSAPTDTFAVKTSLPAGSPQAPVLWVAPVDVGDASNFAQSLSVDLDDNVVMVTSNTSGSAGTVWKICSDGSQGGNCPDGSISWNQTDPWAAYGAESPIPAAFSVAAVDPNDPTGAIYVAGTTLSNGLGAPFLSKFDRFGDNVWMSATPNESYDVCPASLVNNVCSSSPPVQGVRMGFDGGHNIIVASFGNPALGGGINFGGIGTSFPTFPTYGEPNIFLSAYEPNGGALQWATQVPTILSSSLRGLAIGNQGQIVVSGNYSGSMQVDGQLLITVDSEEPTVVDSFLASFAEPEPIGTPAIGAAASCDATGTVTGPGFSTVPDDIVATATSPSGACVFFMPPTSDAPTVTCSPAPNTTFQIGSTPVTCTAYDAYGNSTSAPPFSVTVLPPPPPVLGGLPGSITIAATGPSGAAVSYTGPFVVDGLDNPLTCSSCAAPLTLGGSIGPPPVCSPPLVLATCDRASGSTFPVGTTTVNCTSAPDSSGLTASGSFTVTVNSSAPPTLTLSPNVDVSATGPNGDVIQYSVSATDPLYGTVPVTCVPPSGSTFAPGTTTVACTAADDAGRAATSSFTVTVGNTVTASATAADGAAVTFASPTANSPLYDGPLPMTCVPPSGSTFPIGTTTVTCMATENGGLVGATIFSVTVSDTTPPIVPTPPNVTVPATGANGATVTYATPVANDPIYGSLPMTCVPPSGSTFPLGMKAVTCTASDSAGLTANTGFDVTVACTAPPVITLPPTPAPIQCTSGKQYTPPAATATDICSGGVSVSKPAPVSEGAVGATEVTYTATDSAGTTSSAELPVTVIDTVPPVTIASEAPYPSTNNTVNIDITSFSVTPKGGGTAMTGSADCWPSSGVAVSLNASDTCALKQLAYSLAGAQTGSATVASGQATIDVTKGGSTTVTYYSTDKAGNVEAAKALPIFVGQSVLGFGFSCAPSPHLNLPAHGTVTAKGTVTITNAKTGKSVTDPFNVTFSY